MDFVPTLVTPIQAIPLALVCAYIPHFYKGVLVVKHIKRYDIAHPRDNISHVEKHQEDGKVTKDAVGQIKRAAAAHANGFEAFSYFAAAALAAHVTKVDAVQASKLSTIFLIARFLYNILYIFNIGGGNPRAVIFGAGIAAAGSLMYQAGWQ
jgi:uncharacterized MAPEG superfamily protein